jgi:hypothetical protein
MSRIFLTTLGGACLLAFPLFPFVITHKQDSEIPSIDIKVDVDHDTEGEGTFLPGFQAPYWKNVTRGEHKAWNQETIRKEFGRYSQKVGLTFYPTNTSWYAFYTRPILGRQEFNLDDDIQFWATKKHDGSYEGHAQAV